MSFKKSASLRKVIPTGILAISLTFLSLCAPAFAQQKVYFGTYTGGQSKGIYRSTLDETTGQLTAPELVAETTNPSFLALSPNGKYLYAALEAGNGSVGAWAIGDDQKLTALNQQPAGGNSTCHVWVDATGKNVMVANYGGGNIASFPVNDDGSLGARTAFDQHTGNGPDKSRQQGPFAHSIYTDPTNTFAYSCDLGTDEVRIYRFDAVKGTLTPTTPIAAKVPPGSGPRHLAFHPKGYVYVNNEMGLSVTAFERDAVTGALTEFQTIPTVPEGIDKNGVSTAEISVHPSGKWLYVSNRGRDTITTFAIAEDGKLTWIEETPTPKTPRGFAITPDGKWLIVGGQSSNTVQTFQVNTDTGKLTAGQTVEVGAPVSVHFAPSTPIAAN